MATNTAVNETKVQLTGKASSDSKSKKSKSSKSEPEKIPSVKAEIVRTGDSVKQDVENMRALDKYTSDILAQVTNISKSFCKIGFYLWKVRKDKLYQARDFKNLGDYAESVLHIKKSSAYNYIKVCERFSKYDGHGYPTATLKDDYTDFNFTQLSEALALPEESLKEVKSDMTVSDIRKMRKEAQDGDKSSTASETETDTESKPLVDDIGTLKEDIIFSGVLTAELLDKIIERLSKYVGIDIDCLIDYKEYD